MRARSGLSWAALALAVVLSLGAADGCTEGTEQAQQAEAKAGTATTKTTAKQPANTQPKATTTQAKAQPAAGPKAFLDAHRGDPRIKPGWRAVVVTQTRFAKSKDCAEHPYPCFTIDMMYEDGGTGIYVLNGDLAFKFHLNLTAGTYAAFDWKSYDEGGREITDIEERSFVVLQQDVCCKTARQFPTYSQKEAAQAKAFLDSRHGDPQVGPGWRQAVLLHVASHTGNWCPTHNYPCWGASVMFEDGGIALVYMDSGGLADNGAHKAIIALTKGMYVAVNWEDYLDNKPNAQEFESFRSLGEFAFAA